MKKIITKITILFAAALLIGTGQSCTDLNEEVYDQLSSDALFENPDNLIYAFGGAYTNLYGLIGHKYNWGMDCGTDLLVVPQRGGDWEDGGEWHRYHWLTWTPQEGYISRSYSLNYKGIVLVNKLIATLENTETDATAAISELRGLRAYYYLNLIDQFGNVIINDKFPVEEDFPKNSPRDSVFLFIEKELTEAMPYLSKETGANFYGRVNYYVGEMLLAKLYLNAEVYTGTARWADAEDAIDNIIEGPFELEPNIFNNFIDDASASKEHIFGVPFDIVKAKGLELHLFTNHYSMKDVFGFTSQPWNGLSGQEALYNYLAADPNDERINGILYGPQFDAQGNPVEDASYEKFDPKNPTAPIDPDGPQLNHTPEINMLQPNCLRQAGVRMKKFQYTDGIGNDMGTDVPIYRFADVLLMKAEVMLRQGDAAGALPFVNQVRERAKAADFTEVTLDNLLEERARELFVEGFRRSDLIRFGKYLEPRWEKPETSPDYVTIWPIPESEMGLNANLVQNPGY